MSATAERAWLSGIVALAAATYLAGAWPQAHSLPHGDEINFIETALRLGSGVLEPFGLRHGTGLPLLLAVEFGAWYAVQAALGHMAQPMDLVWAYVRDPSIFFLLGRLTALVAGLAVIVLTWRLGRQLSSAAVGLVAAAFTGLSVLPVTMVVRFKEELPALAALLMGLSCAAALAGFDRRHAPRRLALWAGVWIGIAAAFKYTAGLGLLPVIIGAWWGAGRGVADAERRALWLRNAAWAAAGAAVSFAALSPSAVAYPIMFWNGMSDLAGGYGWFPQPAPPILTRLFRQVPDALGVPVALLALAGGIELARRAPKAGLVLLSFPAALLLILAPYVGVASHLIFAVPMLAISAAVALARIAASVTRRAAVRRIVLVAGAALALWPAYADACRVVALTRRPDTRLLALDWVRRHVPDGSHVLIEGARYGQIYFGPDLPATRESLEADLETIQARGGYGRLAQMRVQMAAAHPPMPAYRLTKVLTASAETVAVTEPDVVITSGYFDRELFDGEPPDAVDVLPCNKADVQRQRRELRAALAGEFEVRVQFDPGVRLHEEFPLLYGGDFIRLRRLPVRGDRRGLRQGPVLTVYQRNAKEGVTW